MSYVACFKCREYFHMKSTSEPVPNRCDHPKYRYSENHFRKFKRDAGGLDNWEELEVEEDA